MEANELIIYLTSKYKEMIEVYRNTEDYSIFGEYKWNWVPEELFVKVLWLSIYCYLEKERSERKFHVKDIEYAVKRLFPVVKESSVNIEISYPTINFHMYNFFFLQAMIAIQVLKLEGCKSEQIQELERILIDIPLQVYSGHGTDASVVTDGIPQNLVDKVTVFLEEYKDIFYRESQTKSGMFTDVIWVKSFYYKTFTKYLLE